MAALTDITWVCIAIAGLFYAGAWIKPLTKAKVCMICLAVSVSWFSLLILRAAGLFANDLILALLLGQSVVGGYYLWERRAPKRQLIFRLPVLLTLTLVAWTLIHLELSYSLLGVVIVIWVIHWLLDTYHTNPHLKHQVAKIIACCSRW